MLNKKEKRRIKFTILLYLFSPLLIIYFILLTITGIVFMPIEYYIYKKKFMILGSYYPLILKFERVIIKTIKYLNLKNIEYVYDKENKTIYLSKCNAFIKFRNSNKNYINNIHFDSKYSESSIVFIDNSKDVNKYLNKLIN